MDREPVMYYGEFEPRPSLRPWIAAYWHFRVRREEGEISHTVPLTGGAMLAVDKEGQVAMVGPRATAYRVVVRGGDSEWGVHFWPGAALSLLGVGGGDLREREVLLRGSAQKNWVSGLAAGLSGRPEASAAIECLNAEFEAMAPRSSPLDERVMSAVFGILASGGSDSIGKIAAACGLSRRQLRRRFSGSVGITPKELARVQRARESAVAAVTREQRWIDIAATHGYADQAHLVREFKRLLDRTPGHFSRHVEQIQHGQIVR